MNTVFRILIFLASVVASMGVVHIVNSFMFDNFDLNSKTDKDGKFYLTLLFIVVIFIGFVLIFYGLGTTFLL